MRHNILPVQICALGPVCEEMALRGMQDDEAYVLGMSESAFLRVGYIHDGTEVAQEMSPDDSVSIVGARDNVSASLQSNLGILEKKVIKNDKDALIKSLCKEVADGHRVQILVESSMLPYHASFGGKGGQTVILLIGYDPKMECFTIVDRHHTTLPLSVYQGPLAKSVAENALLNREDSVKIFLRVDDFECPPSGRAAREAAAGMLAATGRTGVAGLRNVSREAEHWAVGRSCKQLHNLLFQIYAHIVNRVGPALVRHLYGDFLETYVAPRQGTNVQSLAQDFREISVLWRGIALDCFRASRGSRTWEAVGLAQRLSRLADAEERAFASVLEKVEE